MHTMLPFYPSPLWAHLTSLSHDLITGGSHDHTAHYSISNLFSSRISHHLLRVKFLWFGKLWSCCGFYNIKFSDCVDKKSHKILMSWTLIPIWYMTYPSLCTYTIMSSHLLLHPIGWCPVTIKWTTDHFITAWRDTPIAVNASENNRHCYQRISPMKF